MSDEPLNHLQTLDAVCHDWGGFGQVPTIVTEVGRAVISLDLVLEQLQKVTIRQSDVQALLRGLCASDCPDFDSARQVFWSFGQIYSDLDPKLPNDEAIQAVLKKADSVLQLTLPRLEKQSVVRLDETPARRAFDSKACQEMLKSLRELLPQLPKS
jgi:hypothetical protein